MATNINVSKPRSAKKTTKKEINTPTENISAREAAVAYDSTSIEGADTAPSVSYVTRQKIPPDALITVRNATAGKLIYVSRRMAGVVIVWNDFGDENQIEMSELYAMRNTDRRFFSERWIELPPDVLRELHVEEYYKDALSIDEINGLFNSDEDIISRAVSRMNQSQKAALGIKALNMIEEGTLVNIKTITAIEKALGVQLYVR